MKHKLIATFEEKTKPWKVSQAVAPSSIFRVQDKLFGLWFDSEEERNIAKVELEKIGATCILEERVQVPHEIEEEEGDDAIIT